MDELNSVLEIDLHRHPVHKEKKVISLLNNSLLCEKYLNLS